MEYVYRSLLTMALLLVSNLTAAEGTIPVAVAESESFEVVGRLQEEGLVFYIDRSDSNAPVLGATLEVELAGKSAKAVFRGEQGDYQVADAEWLKALRQPGEHALALTLLVGEESDLLGLNMDVHGESTATILTDGRGRWIAGLGGLAVLLGLWFVHRFRKGARK